MENTLQNVTVRSHATNNGRLYIKESEFFTIPKVRRMIERSMNSSIYKEIESKKKEGNTGG